MKKFFLLIIAVLCSHLFTNVPIMAQQEKPFPADKTALLLIDIQMFYFPGGRGALVNPEEASLQAKKILEAFRENKMLVIHVKHQSKTEGDIHPNVMPMEGEKVITKTEASCFVGTDLLYYLKEKGITHLVIAGMMTHMCVEAATRAAHDLGFDCTVISDACATRDLKYGEEVIPAKEVHLSTLATLKGTYANIMTTAELLSHLHE
jgi:nicotinamidase-related amidase